MNLARGTAAFSARLQFEYNSVTPWILIEADPRASRGCDVGFHFKIFEEQSQ